MSSEALRPGLSIRRRAQGRLFRLPVAFPIVLVFGALVSLFYLNQASVVATTGYEVRGLEAERQQWQIRNQQLRLRLAELRSLDRVEEEAGRLGMGPPERRVFVTRRATAAEWVATPAPQPAAQSDADLSMRSPGVGAFEQLVGMAANLSRWLQTQAGAQQEVER